VARGLPGGPPWRRIPQRRELLGAADAVAAAADAGIPCFEVARPGAAAGGEALVDEAGADLVAVACFPWRLTRAWLERPRLGAVNLHPSLLPAFRGPAPLFWQLRAAAPIGISLHRVDAGLDTGPLLAQRAVALADGTRTDAAEERLAAAGAELLAAAVTRGALEGRAQDGASASRQGWPGPGDRHLSPTWTARRAFNFVRGAERWGPFELESGEGTLEVGDALGYQTSTPERRPGERALRFADGWLRVAHG
jgi:methionyl-tRNA formyltransferase